jgi:tripartite-type tricarboxylate transporter receptor subunit TctC
MMRQVRHAFVLVVLFLVCTTLARPSETFSGKTVTVIIGADVGAGFDAYGRAVAHGIGRYLPGNPAVIPRNQPGAGSGLAAAYIYNLAPKDGTTFASLFPGVIVSQLLDERPSGQFDPTRFNYLGSVYGGPRICLTYGSSKIKTFKDAQTPQKATFGATAVGGGSRDYANMVKRIAGAKFDLVTGYRGPNDVYLAIERGEIDGICGQDWSAFKLLRPAWLKDKTVNILLQIGPEPDAELTAMGVPDLWSFVADPRDRAAAELIVTQQTFGGPYVLPPDVPADTVQLLRDAFMKVMADPEFLAEIAQDRLEARPVRGDVVQALIEKLYSAPQPLVDYTKSILRGH